MTRGRKKGTTFPNGYKPKVEEKPVETQIENPEKESEVL
jgi:hypothetical protein